VTVSPGSLFKNACLTLSFSSFSLRGISKGATTLACLSICCDQFLHDRTETIITRFFLVCGRNLPLRTACMDTGISLAKL
jgi:hypothetical protein